MVSQKKAPKQTLNTMRKQNVLGVTGRGIWHQRSGFHSSDLVLIGPNSFSRSNSCGLKAQFTQDAKACLCQNLPFILLVLLCKHSTWQHRTCASTSTCCVKAQPNNRLNRFAPKELTDNVDDASNTKKQPQNAENQHSSTGHVPRRATR